MEMPTWLLSQVSIRAHRLLTDSLATADARGYDYRILAALDEFGPASQISIGRRTGIDRSDVVAAVDHLVARGYVRRTQDSQDRRRNVITVTPSGRAQYRRLDRLIVGVQDALLAPLSSGERTRFVELLHRLVGAAPVD